MRERPAFAVHCGFAALKALLIIGAIAERHWLALPLTLCLAFDICAPLPEATPVDHLRIGLFGRWWTLAP